MRKFILTGIFVVSVGVGTAAQSFMSQDFAEADNRADNVRTKDNAYKSGYDTKSSDPEASLLLDQANDACTSQCTELSTRCHLHCEKYDGAEYFSCSNYCTKSWVACMESCGAVSSE